MRFGGDLGYLMLPDPDYREGYKFMGWQRDGAYHVLSTGKVTYLKVCSDMHFTAVWESTALDYRLQKIKDKLSFFDGYINEHVSAIQLGILNIESQLEHCIKIRNQVNTMSIMKKDKKMAAIEAELSVLDKKQKECEEEIKLSKRNFKRFLKDEQPLIKQVSEVRQMLNSVNDYRDQGDVMILIQQVIKLVDSEMDCGVPVVLHCLKNDILADGRIKLLVDELEMMIEDFWMSHPDLLY